ncbi:hypothetical protein KJ742_01995 [Patescibacteria group bacterium]|nr:hypothetical protein [Patescibacteria group bacterium]MBU1682695.1 hypothetical protein [Patescibacteria group bacterium]MBU1934460.1 hypothetical protein [Patescibacteria group bacterium]
MKPKIKHNIRGIEYKINEIIANYVECRIGIGDFLSKIREYSDCTQDLITVKKKYVAALIDIVIDNLELEMDSDTYNPRDPNTTEKYIDWYYQKYIRERNKKTHNKNSISTDFLTKYFKEYLVKIGKDNNSAINYVDINKILIFAYDDFCSGKNSLDDLSDICNYLHTLLKVSDYSDLEKALHYGSELSFYIRDIKTKTDNQVSNHMIVIKEYVEKIRGYTEKAK